MLPEHPDRMGVYDPNLLTPAGEFGYECVHLSGHPGYTGSYTPIGPSFDYADQPIATRFYLSNWASEEPSAQVRGVTASQRRHDHVPTHPQAGDLPPDAQMSPSRLGMVTKAVHRRGPTRKDRGNEAGHPAGWIGRWRSALRRRRPRRV